MAIPPSSSTVDRVLALLGAGPATAAELARRLWPAWGTQREGIAKAEELLTGLCMERKAMATGGAMGIIYGLANGDVGAEFNEAAVLAAVTERPLTQPDLAQRFAGSFGHRQDVAIGAVRETLLKLVGRGRVEKFWPENEVVAHYRATVVEAGVQGEKPLAPSAEPPPVPMEDAAMAKAKTAAKKAKGNGKPAARQVSYETCIPVTFGGVSIGKGTARIGIAVDRGAMGLTDADRYLCGRRLTGVVRVEPDSDGKQQDLFPDLRHEIRGSFDVPSFRVFGDRYSTSISFSTGEIDARELFCFAKSGGKLYVESTAVLEGSGGDDDEVGEEEAE